jgi:MYXO-CTERM domain-containing protein
MSRTLACLALLTTLFAGPAAADELSPEAIVLDHMVQLADAGVIDFPEALSFDARMTLDWAAGTRVRLSQSLLGIPVHGREIIVSLDPAGRVKRVTGEPLSAVLLDVNPTVAALDASARAEAIVALRYEAFGRIHQPFVDQVVFVGRDEMPRLAWKVRTGTTEPLGNYEVIVDAHTGDFLDVQSTLVHASGNIYPTNPDVSDVVEADLLRLSGAVQGMQGDYAYVNSCVEMDLDWGGEGCTAKERFAVADGDGNFFYDPDPSEFEDPFAEVQMYYHLDYISNWFDEHHGFAHAQQIEGLVNFEYNNAAYGNFDQDQAAEVGFGQTGYFDLAYDADVIYHEFGHSVFGSVAGQTGFLGFDEYGMEWATGGINEGTADVFSMVLTGDPKVGEYAGRAFGYGDAIRDLEDDRHCPTDLYGQSHTDGEVFGAFAWNVIDDPLLGAEFAGDFFWGTVSALPVNANWMDLSEALVEAADDLHDEGLIDDDAHARLGELLALSGLQACGRVIRLDEDQEPTFLLFTMRWAGELPMPAGNQFSLDAPEGAYKLRFRVKEWLNNEPNLEYTLFVRRGEYVHHGTTTVETNWGSMELPEVEDYDFSVDGDGDDFEFELTLDSDPPLEPGATYFFSLNTRATGDFEYGWVNAQVTVDGDSWIEEIEPGDDDDDDGGDGCQSCSSSVASSPAPAGLLALLLGALVLRRRRD